MAGAHFYPTPNLLQKLSQHNKFDYNFMVAVNRFDRQLFLVSVHTLHWCLYNFFAAIFIRCGRGVASEAFIETKLNFQSYDNSMRSQFCGLSCE